MNKISNITSSILAALIVLSCSCTSEDTIKFKAISDPEYSPEDLMDWETHVFVFSGEICTSVQKFDKLSSCRSLDAKSGERVSIVAMKDNSNIGYTALTEGKDAGAYWIVTDDHTAAAPEIWTATFNIPEGEVSVSQILKPLTSNIHLSVTDAPENFSSVKVCLEGFDNIWNIFSDESGTDAVSSPVEIVSTGEDVEMSVLPINADAGVWPPKILVSFQDEEIAPKMELDWIPGRGSEIHIEIDFSKYQSYGTFDLIYTYGDILNPYSIKTARKCYDTAASAGFGQNRHYQVQIESGGGWRIEHVHDALCSDADKHASIWNDWANVRKLRDTMSYCLIESEFPAKIKVRKFGNSYSKVAIRPSTYNIEAIDCGNNTIEFTLPEESKGKVSVEFDDDRQHNLFIYARTPDKNKPSTSDPSVKYFGKGEHNPGTILLTEGQTLYIDHGAKVYANVKTSGNNVTIAGHGILSGEKMVHKGDNLYSWGDFLINCNTTGLNARNLTIKDITMIDSPGWNMIIPKTSGVVIDGVNMISWELNGDGIDIVSSNNVEIKNCFIRTYDDCMTLKCRFIVKPIIDTYDIRIHDCIIWADYARGIVIGPEAGNTAYSGRIHDIEVKDCIFLQHKRGLNDDQRSAFAIGQGSDGSTDLWKGTDPPTTMSDITATNLIFDNIDESGRNASIWQYGGTPVLMENVTLSDFRVIDKMGNSYPALYIKTNGSTIKNLNIQNLTVNGVKVTGTGTQFSIDKESNVAYSIN